MTKKRRFERLVVREQHIECGREPNGRTQKVLDKAVATKEGAHSTVKCGDYSVLTLGKTSIDINSALCL